MRIAILVEGATERVFMKTLRDFLRPRLQEMPRLHPVVYDGRIDKEDKLKRQVEKLLETYDAVIGLTDVYTGTNDFNDASDAKAKMAAWVGGNANFFPHAAQHDMLRSTILKLGCYHSGPPFKLWPDTIKQRHQDNLNMLITTIRPPTA
jgi:hypothetical protein